MALIEKFDSVSAAATGLREMLARKDLIMGFGHRVGNTFASGTTHRTQMTGWIVAWHTQPSIVDELVQ